MLSMGRRHHKGVGEAWGPRRSERSGRWRGSPTRIVALLVAGVAFGALCSSAAAQGGALVAFGKNGQGELGTGFKDVEELAPVTVADSGSVVQVSQGFNFTLVLTASGTVESWGENNYGQLGLNKVDEPKKCLTARPVPDLEEVVAVAAAGTHAMALERNGSVWTWGTTQAGELGTGKSGLGEGEEVEVDEGGEIEPEESGCMPPKSPPTKAFTSQPTPVEVTGLPEAVIAIAAGGASDYALLAGGKVEAWGENANGQLGLPPASEAEHEACDFTSESPNETVAERKAHKVEKYRDNEALCPRLCLTEVGVVACRSTPHVVEDAATEKEFTEEGTRPLQHVVKIAAGEESAYAVVEEGGKTHAMAWGNNGKGELGSGGATVHINETPQEVKNLSDIEAIAAGDHQVLAIADGGKVYGWGNAGSDDLVETGEKSKCQSSTPCYRTPILIPGIHGAAEAVAGGKAASFVTVSGKVYAFGDNEYGKLGVNQTANKVAAPTPVEGIGAAAEVASSEMRTSVLLAENDAPPRLLELIPGSGSLEARWTFKGGAKVRETPVKPLYKKEGHEWTKSEEVREPRFSFTWPAAGENSLSPVLYQVVVTELGGRKEGRTIYGTPLPL